MLPTQSGSFRLFRVAGVQVYLHWWWFLAAWYFLSTRSYVYSSWGWNVAEYLSLFLIVLIHEFGHVLACRQVGGVANEIVLWPLGGVAFAQPPPRPGAELWTIAAGPLVNVVLWPILVGATVACSASGLSDRIPDLERLLFMVFQINKVLLFFNLLPIYPLDGGQMLRSLLWFKLGRARSLQVAAVLGLVGIALGVGWRLWRSPNDWMWTALLGFFIGSQCLAGLRHARALLALDKLPRHADFACPSCHRAPPGGPLWQCGQCGNRFDVFSTRAICPHCQTHVGAIRCVHCGTERQIENWKVASRGKGPEHVPYVDI